MYHGIQNFDPNAERIHLEMETGRVYNYILDSLFILFWFR
jgi:hypothetical protein